MFRKYFIHLCVQQVQGIILKGVPSLVPRPTLCGGRIWCSLSDFWGLQDVAYLAIGMAVRHPLSIICNNTIAL